MKKTLYFVSIVLLSFASIAQQGDGGEPFYDNSKSTSTVIDARFFSEPDVAALKAEDAITDPRKDSPWRFGFNNYTNFTLLNSGTWTDLANGGKIWQLSLTCENALTVNLTFEDVIIPEGDELYVFNPEKTFILGKFTSKHLYEGQLGTELVPGETVIVEYYVAPQNVSAMRGLKIATITHGYRTAAEFQEKAFGSSGSCNMNSICPDGDPIRDEIQSTVMLVSGSNGFCTGAVVNNTANDGTPYVLTANHCYSNPASWIFRFNWASPTCNNPGSSPSFLSLSGATLRARRTPSDFCLVEITGGLETGGTATVPTIPSFYGAFFAGWNRSDIPATSAHCVHHPSGDIKKISFDDNPLVEANGMGSTEPNSQWKVIWDRNTTTEPGSSGSPLFDQNGRIVGQLWGGGASCTNLTSPDYYGKFSVSWDTDAAISSQLKHWLDPNNTGDTIIDGTYFHNASIDELSNISVNVFPNPNDGAFNVTMDEVFTTEVTVTVSDLSGRIVYQEVVSNQTELSIQLTDVTNGVYILELSNEEASASSRIVVRR